jgi:hypothetical protein
MCAGPMERPSSRADLVRIDETCVLKNDLPGLWVMLAGV